MINRPHLRPFLYAFSGKNSEAIVKNSVKIV